MAADGDGLADGEEAEARSDRFSPDEVAEDTAELDGADDDIVTDYGDVKVVSDPMSAQLLDGATLDFADGLMGTGFSIDNPNAQRSCGCGQSFS